MEKIDFSVVIRTFNSEKDIKRCLDSVFIQKGNFEVVAVDSGSSDRTLEILSGYKIRLLKIQSKGYTPGKALNLGASVSKGKHIIFLSSDAELVGSSCFLSLIDSIKKKGVGFAYARQVPYKNASPFEARRVLGTFGRTSKESNSVFASNACSIVEKSVWSKFKFNESLKIAEDIELANRLLSKGHAIHYNTGCIVKHSHNYTLKNLFVRHSAEFFHNHALIFPKSKSNIFFLGLKEFLHNSCQDFNFCMKKRKYISLLRLPFYNVVVMLAYFFAALKPRNHFRKLL